MKSRYVIRARSPKGNKLTLTRKGFSTRGEPWTFATLADASKQGRRIVASNAHILRQYVVYAEPLTRKNPGGYVEARDAYLRELDEAADKFETFTGYRATKETRFAHKSVRAGFALGALVSVTYEQNRKGDGLSHYEHKFKKNSRPLLVSSNDGTQLAIVGGRYRVSEETGINDE